MAVSSRTEVDLDALLVQFHRTNGAGGLGMNSGRQSGMDDKEGKGERTKEWKETKGKEYGE